MNIDERLERLVARHEALTETVELLAHETRDLRAAIGDLDDGDVSRRGEHSGAGPNRGNLADAGSPISKATSNKHHLPLTKDAATSSSLIVRENGGLRMRSRVYLLLLAAVSAYGLDPNRTLTQYVHRIWQVQQGLPEASIFSILQTGDGFLWLGTQTGLVRFDGVRFTPLEDIYKSAPANVWIRDAAEDSRGAMWIGTNESGIFRMDQGAITHYSQKDGLPSNTIQCVVVVQNDVWACTASGPWFVFPKESCKSTAAPRDFPAMWFAPRLAHRTALCGWEARAPDSASGTEPSL